MRGKKLIFRILSSMNHFSGLRELKLYVLIHNKCMLGLNFQHSIMIYALTTLYRSTLNFNFNLVETNFEHIHENQIFSKTVSNEKLKFCECLKDSWFFYLWSKNKLEIFTDT